MGSLGCKCEMGGAEAKGGLAPHPHVPRKSVRGGEKAACQAPGRGFSKTRSPVIMTIPSTSEGPALYSSSYTYELTKLFNNPVKP